MQYRVGPSHVPQGGLLAVLSSGDRKALLDRCESIDLVTAEVLCEAGAPIRHVYFPIASIISLCTTLADGAQLEVGAIGDEGLLGATLILGADVAGQTASVQSGGAALRLSAAAYLRQCRQSPTLRQRCSLYLWVELRQLALIAACTHHHLIEARLARWLLATRDRSHSRDFHITHEYLSQRLGVRRVGVTEAASSLQGRGLIHYSRGAMTITDGPGLERAACGCYRSAIDMYGKAFARANARQRYH